MNKIIITSTIFASIGSYFLIIDDDPRKMIRNSLAKTHDRSSVRARLDEIGRTGEIEYQNFRLRQLSFVGASTFFVVTAILIVGKSLLSGILLGVLSSLATYFYTERELTVAVNRHRSKIEAEFPAMIEMLTLALSAGETPLTAMRRISICANGLLADEFARTVRHVHAGEPFHIALDRMGRSLHSFLIRRFVDAFITAMARGAPVIEVLSRHALEARENQRNRILGAAAKAEISMMIPVVFLILPISILFALWPSLMNLNLFAS
jgi:tight adherence protein C